MLSLAAASCRNEAPVVQKTNSQEASTNEPYKETSTAKRLPTFSADSALLYIRQQCDFGARVPNTEAHEKCADYLKSKLTQFGAEVQMQKFEATAFDGTKIKGTNIIGSIYPEKGTRIALFSHWDSRPFSDQDDEKYFHTPVMGANDGASGVGVMMEIARIIQGASPDVGIDFVCFDAEDCGTPEWDDTGDIDADTWCIGSQYWAQHVTDDYPGFISNCRYGILLDMVGGSNSVFYKESYSKFYAPNVVDKVWAAAQRLGYTDYFKNTEGGAVTDDHLQVNKAGIRCIDIIGSDSQNDGHFPSTWHTMNDNIQNIDRQTLTAVGQTLLSIIYNEQ